MLRDELEHLPPGIRKVVEDIAECLGDNEILEVKLADGDLELLVRLACSSEEAAESVYHLPVLPTRDEIFQIVEDLFISSREEHFEDGMESRFSRKLLIMISTYDDAVIDAIANIIETANTEVLSEALRWVGYIEHARTRRARSMLLEKCLRHPVAQVRDGALLGIASMENLQFVPALQRAIRRESCEELKKCMQQVLFEMVHT